MNKFLVFDVKESSFNQYLQEDSIETFYERGILFIRAKDKKLFNLFVKEKGKEVLKKLLRNFELLVLEVTNGIVAVYFIKNKILIKINKVYLDWIELREDLEKIFKPLNIVSDLKKVIPNSLFNFSNLPNEEARSEVNYMNSKVKIKIVKYYSTFIFIEPRLNLDLRKKVLDLFSKKVVLKFKKIGLDRNKTRVKIETTFEGKKVNVFLSILQLAKLWKKDKEVVKIVEEMNTTTKDLEMKCKETRKAIATILSSN